MNKNYFDLIDQTYYFPQEGFDLSDGYLTFHGVSLKYLIDKYGTPFKLLYLPRIGQQIRRAKNLFNRAINKSKYRGKYFYSYCTKCCHFAHVIKTALKEGVHLETSSAFDIDLILRLYQEGEIDKKIILIHNGYKTESYLQKIKLLNELGFENSISILDSIAEIQRITEYAMGLGQRIKVGIRMAIDEEPQSAYYTSRLGIRANEILDVYRQSLQQNEHLELKMMHFFVDSGVKDNLYYWGVFQKALNIYTKLKKACPSLIALNLGGGFPIRNSLGFKFDYEMMVNEMVSNIQFACEEANIEEPHIFTEYGKYTVGESGAIIFQVLEQKQQNDSELWYLVDNSLMNTIPDAWSIYEKFILLPINKWERPYARVSIGGISCDHSDYYNSDDMNQQVILPTYNSSDKEPLYIGFFHTAAYQDSISGYGGIKHCLIPSPKHIIVDRDEKGNFVDTVYRNEQTVDEMLSILGFDDPLEEEKN